MKLDDLFQALTAMPLEDAKEASLSLSLLVDKQTELLEKIHETQENREHDLLDFFDDLKFEINKILDFAYEKEVKKIRRSHERQTSKLTKQFRHAKQLINLYSHLADEPPTELEDTDFADLANTLSLLHNQKSSLTVALRHELQCLNSMLKKEAESEPIQTELKAFCARKKTFCDFLIDTFEIQEYRQQSNSTDSAKAGSVQQKGSYSGHEGQIFSLAVINSEQIATAGADKLIKLWDLRNGECFLELKGHQDTVWDLKSGFDGKYLFSASEDKDIKIWRVSDGKCKKTMTGHKTGAMTLCVLPAKKLMMSGSKEGGVIIWDLGEKKIKREIEAHVSTVRAVRYLGRNHFATAADDGWLKVWDAKSGELIKALQASEGQVTCMSVFDKGRRVLLGDSVGDLKIWDVEGGKQIAKITAHHKGVLSAAMSADGQLIASGGGDAAFRLWDLHSAALLKQIEGNDSAIHCLEFLDELSVMYCDLNPKKYKFSKW